jgi:hypothetical protein
MSLILKKYICKRAAKWLPSLYIDNLVTCCSRGRRQLSHGVPFGLGRYQGIRPNREIQGIAVRIFTGKIWRLRFSVACSQSYSMTLNMKNSLVVQWLIFPKFREFIIISLQSTSPSWI